MTSDYEPVDNGTFMNKVMTQIKQNPGMAAAGLSMLGNMRSGSTIKFAVAAFAAYKLYSAHQNKQQAKTDGTYQSFGKRLVTGATNTVKKTIETGKAGYNKAKNLYEKYQNNAFDKNLESRMGKISAYERAAGSQVDPKLGFSKNQFEDAIERVAPISNTPTMKSMFEAAQADKSGAGADKYRRYLDNVASNAEHKIAWEQHLDQTGVQNLSDLKFCATGPDGTLLKDAKGKTIVVNPYDELKSMPHGKTATVEQLYQYQARKADIDKTVMYAMDHGQICGMKGDTQTGFTRIDAPKDAYNAKLSEMDAANREFAGTKAAIREEQVKMYYEAPSVQKDAATPPEIQATGKSSDFQAVVTAVNGFRAKAQGDRALAAEKGVDYERVQLAEMLKSSKSTSIDFESAPRVKQAQQVQQTSEVQSPTQEAPEAPHESQSTEPVKQPSESVLKAMAEADALQEKMAAQSGIEFSENDFAGPDPWGLEPD